MKLNIEKADLTGILLTIGFGVMLILLWNHGKVSNQQIKEPCKKEDATRIDLTALDR